MLKSIIAFAALAIASTSHAQLRIVTTTTDFADLARQIGVDRVQVHSVMKGPENVHNVIATPTHMLALNKADLFVHSGLDAEPWRDSLIKGARNPKILPGESGEVDMSAGIELKEAPTGRIDRSMGDIHAYGNPHYTPNLHNGQRMLVTLVNAMAAADPPNAEFYRRNAKQLVIELGELQAELERQMQPFAGLKVVTFHNSWVYFTDAFRIDVVATIEPKPGITPSPSEMRRVVDTMKREGVKIVIVETYSSLSQARSVAQAAGAQVIVLPDHVLGVPDADSFQNLFRYNVSRLIDAAREAGIPESATTAPASAPHDH